MKRIAVFLALAVLASPLALGQAPPVPPAPAPTPSPMPAPDGLKKLAIQLPGSLSIEKGRLLLIRPKTEAANLVYVVTDCKGTSAEPGVVPNDPGTVKVYSLAKDCDLFPYFGQACLFLSQRAGTYHVLCYTAAGDKPSLPALCQVTVIDPTPPPPPPPGPNPPPPPPGPNDPLLLPLRGAYQLEADPAKQQHLAALGEVYKQAATVADRQDLATWGALFGAMQAGAQAAGVNGKIMGVQKVLQAELVKLLPRDPNAPLDSAGRATAKQVFSRLALVIGAV